MPNKIFITLPGNHRCEPAEEWNLVPPKGLDGYHGRGAMVAGFIT